MKRIIALFIAVILCFGLFGCGKKTAEEEITPQPSQVEESAEETVDTAALEEYNAYLSSLFKGILMLEERAGAYGDPQLGGGTFVPMRFSHDRIEAYEQYGATARVGTPYFNCTTGIRMDFYTDADEISFYYVVKESFFDRSPDHPDDCFALFENGVLKETYLVQNGTNQTLSYTKEEVGESRITIVFPSWHGVLLSQFNLGNARPYEEYDYNVIVFGDSISQGLFADHPGENWVHLVAENFNANYINLAVGGEVFRKDAFDFYEGFVPDHIFVALGENDFYSGVPEAQMAQNCREYLTQLKMMYPNTPVTVISSFNTDKPESWTQAMLSTAQTLGCNVIDGTAFGGNAAENWNVDRVHPSSLGFKEIAKNIIPEIQSIILG